MACVGTAVDENRMLHAHRVAGMAIIMQVTGDPASTIANTIAFSTFAAIALGMAAVVYAALLRSDL